MKTEQHSKLVEQVVEVVAEFCGDNMVSGQAAWAVVEQLAKLRQLHLKNRL